MYKMEVKRIDSDKEAILKEKKVKLEDEFQ